MGPDRPPTFCGCCRRDSLTVHGFVSRDGYARAVYYASWMVGHPDRGMTWSVGLGDWGSGFGPRDRAAFCLQYRHAPERSRGFILTDAMPFVREQAKILGIPVDRAPVLIHPWKAELFEICDAVLESDARIRAFLEG